MKKSSIEEIFQLFIDVKKPQKVKGCDCSFCLSEEEIISLLNAEQKSLTWENLYGYVDNVLITIGSCEDFTFLLPTILRIWSEQLYSTKSSAYNQRLHWALTRQTAGKRLRDYDCENIPPVNVREGFFYTDLSNEFREAVLDFMTNEILKRIGNEESLLIIGKSPTHSWFRVFASYGVFSPCINKLWEQWWEAPTQGHAIALVQYASCLICDEKNNPVFAPWGPNIGGGAPLLWSYESFNFGEYRLEENLRFLNTVLSIKYLQEKLEMASSKISDPLKVKIVTEVAKILSKESKRTELRIKELIELLGKPSTPYSPFQWAS